MKSYAKNGFGQVCAFDSKRERDAFIQLVNDKLTQEDSRVSENSFMTTCTAREAYKVRDNKDNDGEFGWYYYDMNAIEFFEGDWDVLDQMPAC